LLFIWLPDFFLRVSLSFFHPVNSRLRPFPVVAPSYAAGVDVTLGMDSELRLGRVSVWWEHLIVMQTLACLVAVPSSANDADSAEKRFQGSPRLRWTESTTR
jgi:hypothetical protein